MAGKESGSESKGGENRVTKLRSIGKSKFFFFEGKSKFSWESFGL
jgi:hypothetical protein